jgi:uncharacterized protein with HEPN domain
MTCTDLIAQVDPDTQALCLPVVPVQTSEHIDQARDIVDDIDILDEASTAMESLLNIYGVCERTATNGLEPASAKLMMISTEHICNRLGISLKDEIPALEHFESIHTTSQATTISLETIGETISRIFAAFIEMMKNLIAKIFTFFQTLFDEAEQKRTEQYQRVIKEEIERLKKQSGKKPSNDTFITNQRLITAFSDPEKGIDDETVQRILKNAEMYCEFLIAAADPVSKYFEEMITSLKEFNSEISQQHFDTFIFGEKLDERVGFFLNTQFNKAFEHAFDQTNKTNEPFDKKLIKGCDSTNIDGDIRASGLLVNGVRFAYYLQKSSFALTCEQTQQTFSYQSSDDTVYKLPELDLANGLNNQLSTLAGLMIKLSAFVNQKHARMEQEIKRLMSSALANVNHAERKVTSDQYAKLYISVKAVMHLLTEAFTFYKDAYGAGLVAIKNTSDCGNMMSKEIVTRYQDIARNQEK